MFNIHPSEEVCANCIHYYPHYTKDCCGYVVCNCGHCVYPRFKGRAPGQKGCEHFRQKKPIN